MFFSRSDRSHNYDGSGLFSRGVPSHPGAGPGIIAAILASAAPVRRRVSTARPRPTGVERDRAQMLGLLDPSGRLR